MRTFKSAKTGRELKIDLLCEPTLSPNFMSDKIFQLMHANWNVFHDSYLYSFVNIYDEQFVYLTTDFTGMAPNEAENEMLEKHKGSFAYTGAYIPFRDGCFSVLRGNSFIRSN